MRRIRLDDNVDEDRHKRVGALIFVQMSYQPWKVPAALVCAGDEMRPTKDDLAAVQDADELVARRLIMVYLE